MPFAIKGLKLPFVKISAKPTTGRTLTWHLGPWSYNSRTGRHTVKVSRKVQYVSRTRTQKAAAKKVKATGRATERAGWDTYFAGKASGVPAPPPPRRPAKKTATKKSNRKKRPATVTHTSGTPAPPATTAPTRSAPPPPASPTRPRPAPTPAAVTEPAKKTTGADAGKKQRRVVQIASGNDRIESMIGRIDNYVVDPAAAVERGELPPGTGGPSKARKRGNDAANVTMIATENATVGSQVGFLEGGLVMHTDGTHPAQQCGQTTADGTACERLGTCPPGTHHPRRRSTGKKGKR